MDKLSSNPSVQGELALLQVPFRVWGLGGMA
jgi:hypothetical protein